MIDDKKYSDEELAKLSVDDQVVLCKRLINLLQLGPMEIIDIAASVMDVVNMHGGDTHDAVIFKLNKTGDIEDWKEAFESYPET